MITNGHVVTPAGLIEDGLVAIEGERVTFAGVRVRGEATLKGSRGPGRVIDAEGGYVCPGFIDLHVHGGGGADVMDGTPAALDVVCRTHASYGTTSLVATTVTAPLETLAAVGRVVRGRMGKFTGGARIVGLHLEGPYIHPSKAGAQAAQHARRPRRQELAGLYGELGDAWRVVTLAPELAGARDAVDWLTARGVVVALGHSTASFAEAEDVFAAGARHVTHTFNAMGPLHHREPGLVGAALAAEHVTVDVIADGLHVHPAVLKLLYRCKGPEHILLITDCIGALGRPEGEYALGDMPVVVKGREARLRDDPGTLAGSLLTMDEAVRTMVHRVGVPLPEAVRMASLNAAALLGIDDHTGSLAAGKDADIVVLDRDLNVMQTLVRGRVVFSR